MTIASNQPYLFPYLGYFQLIYGADMFVVSDSMQYEPHSWINRNHLLIHGRPHLIVSPVVRSNYLLPISGREYMPGVFTPWIKAIEFNYARAPFKNVVSDMLNEWAQKGVTNVAQVNIMTLQDICRYIGIDTPFKRLSQLAVDMSLDKVSKTMEIVKVCDGHRYVNLPGGRALYDKATFAREGIELQFLEPSLPPYRQQHTKVFHPGLSILDLLCNLSPSEILDMVKSARFS